MINQKLFRARRREHNRKVQALRRSAYQFVRDELPEIWEELRKRAGMNKPGRPGKKKKAK